MLTVRTAAPEDAEALLAIYAQYINTSITFETELPSVSDFAARIGGIYRKYPYLVCLEDGIPITYAYAYAHQQQERRAYDWNAELSVYVDPRHTGRGIGKRLCSAMLDLLALQGIKTAYSIVTQPNEPSVGIHDSLGFSRIGVCRNTGYKAGAWHDTMWFDKALGNYDNPPRPVTPFEYLPSGKVRGVIEKYFPAE